MEALYLYASTGGSPAQGMPRPGARRAGPAAVGGCRYRDVTEN